MYYDKPIRNPLVAYARGTIPWYSSRVADTIKELYTIWQTFRREWRSEQVAYSCINCCLSPELCSQPCVVLRQPEGRGELWSCEPFVIHAILAVIVLNRVDPREPARLMLADRYSFDGVEYLEGGGWQPDDTADPDEIPPRHLLAVELGDWLMQEFDWEGHTVTKAVWFFVFYVINRTSVECSGEYDIPES
ncbi:hypothetical protein N7494_001466 [Penicillium frequentans]|uniref:Uncharacterized protein n=1 Tax=Penicillium frequentans TaxID=3151616 RepID=A0AAD6GIZ2_9EURO|nr:hypothetical protein N7494_008415 [Penicillium glabrum]KAJ5552088.1 hypothetical protein N7494_001466 [Penicillium glabrum]